MDELIIQFIQFVENVYSSPKIPKISFNFLTSSSAHSLDSYFPLKFAFKFRALSSRPFKNDAILLWIA